MNLSEVYIKKYPTKVYPNKNGVINPLQFNFRVSSDRPENVTTGSVSYDMDSGRAYVFNGTVWVQIGAMSPWQI